MEEYRKVEEEIFNILNICPCQRNASRIFPILKRLLIKLLDEEHLTLLAFEDYEIFIIALLDTRIDFITHGINIEYPIAMKEDIKIILGKLTTWELIKK